MQHVVALAGEVFIALVHARVFVDRAEVRRAKRRDLPPQLRDALVGAGGAFDLDALLRRRGRRQLVGIPKPVDELLFLQLARGLFLLQSGRFALHLQNGLVFLLRVLLGPVSFGFNGGARFGGLLQRLAALLRLLVQPRDLLLLRGKLGAQIRDLPLIVGKQRFLLRAVALHRVAQGGELGDLLLRALLLRLPGRGVHPQRRDALGKRTSLLGKLRLPLLQNGDLGRERVRLTLRVGAERLERLLLCGVGTAAAGQARKLCLIPLQILAQCVRQRAHLLFLLGAAQRFILRLAELALHGLEFKFRLCRRAGRLLQLRGKLRLFAGELLDAFLQSVYLIGAGQNARAAGRRAARHAAAGVQHLPVQRDDLRAAARGTRHGNRIVQRPGNDRSAEQILGKLAIFRIRLHQLRRHAHIAPLRGELPRCDALCTDGAQRHERRPPGVHALEQPDAGLAVVVRVHHDVLHRRAERGLDGGGIVVVRAQKGRHRPVHAAQYPARRLLHHGLDGLGKALIIALHLAQHFLPRAGGVQLHLYGRQLLLQPLPPVGLRFQPQRVAGDGVSAGRHILLRLRKRLTARRELPRNIVLPRDRRRVIVLQRPAALRDLVH